MIGFLEHKRTLTILSGDYLNIRNHTYDQTWQTRPLASEEIMLILIQVAVQDVLELTPLWGVQV